jgi:hypothetical protein
LGKGENIRQNRFEYQNINTFRQLTQSINILNLIDNIKKHKHKNRHQAGAPQY